MFRKSVSRFPTGRESQTESRCALSHTDFPAAALDRLTCDYEREIARVSRIFSRLSHLMKLRSARLRVTKFENICGCANRIKGNRLPDFFSESVRSVLTSTPH